MPNLARTHALTVSIIAAIGLALSACSEIGALAGPTHRYVLEADREVVGDRLGQDADSVKLLEESVAVLGERLLSSDVIIHEWQVLGDNRLVLAVAGPDHAAAMQWAVGPSATLEIRLVDMDALPADTQQGIAPPGSEVLPQADSRVPMAVKRLSIIKGRDIEIATAAPDPNTNQYLINLRLNERGANRFAGVTSANVGKALAIVIDGEVVSAPIIYEPILGGAVQVSGGFTEESANALASQLGSGALPSPLKIIDVSEID